MIAQGCEEKCDKGVQHELLILLHGQLHGLRKGGGLSETASYKAHATKTDETNGPPNPKGPPNPSAPRRGLQRPLLLQGFEMLRGEEHGRIASCGGEPAFWGWASF